MNNANKPLTRIFQQEWVPLFKEWYAILPILDKVIIKLRVQGQSNSVIARKLGFTVRHVEKRIETMRKAFHGTFGN